MPFSTVDAEAISLIAMKHSGNPGDLIHNLILVTLPQQPEDLRRNQRQIFKFVFYILFIGDVFETIPSAADF